MRRHNLGFHMERFCRPTEDNVLKRGENIDCTATTFLRISDLAKELHVHVNTIRIYETSGFLSNVSRGTNGYRQYCAIHLEQARLAHLALHWPYVGNKQQLIDLVKSAVNDDLGIAKVSVDMLRNWERNGLLTVPRNPTNQYRLYGSVELGRLRVIRMLVKCGFSLIAILRMLQQVDQGNTGNLREALHIPHGEKIDEANKSISAMADRWLATLLELEQRAQQIIEQIGRLIEIRVPVER